MDLERVKLILQGYTHRIIHFWIENKSLPNIEQFEKMQQDAINDPALDDKSLARSLGQRKHES